MIELAPHVGLRDLGAEQMNSSRHTFLGVGLPRCAVTNSSRFELTGFMQPCVCKTEPHNPDNYIGIWK